MFYTSVVLFSPLFMLSDFGAPLPLVLIAITLAFGMLSNLMLYLFGLNTKQVVNQQTGVYRTKIDILNNLIKRLLVQINN
jgi:hypothetical protein